MALSNMSQDQQRENRENREDDVEKKRQRSELQRSIIILESDYRKKITERVQIDADMRKLRKEEEMARVNQRVKQEELKKLDQDVMVMENEIKGLKKKLNLI